MKYCAEVGPYKLVVVQLPDQRWSIVIRGNGEELKPVHDFVASLEEAKMKACLRASSAASLDYTEEVCAAIQWSAL
jgi:CO dehydrogenase/acetyl-CoA synthase delta subunit